MLTTKATGSIAVLAVGAVLLSGCAAQVSASAGAPGAVSPNATAAPNIAGPSGQVPAGGSAPSLVAVAPGQLPDPPKIDWDHPIPEGLTANPVTAQATGQLAASVVLPRFALTPVMTQVTDPKTTAVADRVTALVYNFGKSAAFPVDGRVRVFESVAAPSLVQAWDAEAKSHYPGMTFTRLQIAGNQALLLSANGIGRVLMLRAGIEYDITGPAVSPAEVQLLAAKL